MAKMFKLTSKTSRLVALVLLIVLVIALLEVTNTTNFLHTQKARSGTIPALDSHPKKQTASSTTDTASSDTATANNSTSAPQDTPKDAGGGVSSGDASLIAPFGSFVSNHSPSLSASSATQELSSCSTTIGAVCHIEFTQGDVIRKLEPRTVDSSGSVSWLWDIKQAGLTAGTWRITAVASLNGQTKSSQDQLSLEVTE